MGLYLKLGPLKSGLGFVPFGMAWFYNWAHLIFELGLYFKLGPLKAGMGLDLILGPFLFGLGSDFKLGPFIIWAGFGQLIEGPKPSPA